MVWLYGVKEGLCRGNGKDNGNYRLGFLAYGVDAKNPA